MTFMEFYHDLRKHLREKFDSELASGIDVYQRNAEIVISFEDKLYRVYLELEELP